MKHGLSWGWLAVLTSVLVTGRAQAAEPPCPPSRLCIDAANFKRVLVMPQRLLPTRLRVSFDSEVVTEDKATWKGTAGQHVEVEWDPLQSGRLPRTVNLGPGQWAISFALEPVPLASSDPQRLPVYLSASFKHEPAKPEKTFTGTFYYLGERTGDAKEPSRVLSIDALNDKAGIYAPVDVILQVQSLPLLEDAVGGLSASEGGAIGGRSIDGTASQAVNELFSILAELAFEQASSRAFQILSDRLTTVTCVKLRMSTLLSAAPGPTPEKDVDVTRLLLRPPDEPSSDKGVVEGLLLPNTCSAVKGLRMQELATAGSTLQDALSRDLLWVATSALHPQLKPSNGGKLSAERSYASQLLTQLFVMLGSQLMNHRTLELRQAQLVLLEASRHGWTSADANAYTCGVQVAFAAMAQCHASGRCDARQVVELVRYPERSFDVTKSGCKPYLGGDKVAELRALWPDLEQLIERGLQVLQPSARSNAREHLRLTVELGLALVERGSTKADDVALAALLKDVRLIMLGIVDQDVQPVLLGAGRLIRRAGVDLCHQEETAENKAERALVCDGKLPAELSRATHLMAAVTSYARTYSDSVKADPRQLEAAREARKNAIRSLVLATTDRTQRDGEQIVSLGIAVGSALGGLQAVGENDAEWLLPQLSLPIGVALQRLPDSRGAGCERWSGWHLQFSFADLGQYVTYNKDGDVTDARWDTALMLGLQAGWLLGNSRDQLLIGADLRYSPTLFKPRGQEAGGGAFRAGVMAAYYVPFFDFN